MNAEKVVGPNEGTYDYLKPCGEESAKRLKDAANGLLDGKEMPQSWKMSEIPPLCKG